MECRQEGAVSVLQAPAAANAAITFDYRDFSNWLENRIKEGALSRSVRIEFGAQNALHYTFFEPGFFTLILRDTTFRKSQFSARGYAIFRTLFAGTMSEETEERSHDHTGVECSILSPADATMGWQSKVRRDDPITSLVIFCKTDWLESKLAGSQSLPPFLKPNDDAAFALTRLKPSADLIRVGRDLLELDQTNAAAVLQSESYSLAMLSEFLRIGESARDISEGTTQIGRQDIVRLTDARDIVLEEFAQAPTLDQLARRTGLNRRKLTEGFRELFGSSVHDFVVDRRMELASKLISENVALAEVAHQCGYANVHSFSRAFKDHLGATPGAFAKGHD